MSESNEKGSRSFYVKSMVVVLLFAAAGVAGWWTGNMLGPDSEGMGVSREEGADSRVSGGFQRDLTAPPLFFFPGKGLGEGAPAAVRTIQMAAAAGIHDYVIPVSGVTPWKEGESEKRLIDAAATLLQHDPMAVFLIYVDLNPDEAWVQAHPKDCLQHEGAGAPYPSIACEDWRDDAEATVRKLVHEVESGPLADRTLGYALCALNDGHWVQPEGFDRSPSNVAGFRKWLEGRYGNAAALQSAWNNPKADFDTVAIPDAEPGADTREVFVSLPDEMPRVDFLRYTSESVADTIARLAAAIQEASEGSPEVLAPYGFSYELMDNASGHGALGLLLNSDLTGFVSPVSYADRGVGGTGAPMGPITSAALHGKKCYLVDDTRTGVAWSNQTATAERIRGLRPEDVYNVQRRNFAFAAMHGMGLIWSDPLGEGWLLDEDQWTLFGQMRDIYVHVNPLLVGGGSLNALQGPLGNGGGPPEEPGDETSETPPEEEAGWEAEAAEDFVPVVTLSQAQPGLTVVVDEESRFFQHVGAAANDSVLHQGLSAALRSGISTRFVLLRDVIEGFSAPSTVYLFLNSFVLSEEDRDALHQRFADEHACVIWLYAPGYFGPGTPVENVGATVQMNVAAFDSPERAGSAFLLPGQWMHQDEGFGASGPWGPLFHIRDSAADPLARYKGSDQVSLAVRVIDSGWTSVYAAEPGISPALLSEVLRMLEQHLNFRPEDRNFFDLSLLVEAAAGERLLAVHARHSGDRVVNLNGFYYVQDLFDPAALGRPKESFLLPMRNGETHFFRLMPL